MLADSRVLDTTHVPQSDDLLVARNDELDALTAPVRDFFSGLPETHALLTGPTGTGKTLLAEFVRNEIDRERFADTIYVDCWNHHRTHALYQQLLQGVGDHVRVDERGISKLQLRERFRNHVADGDPCVVVLDELVQLDDLREFWTLYDLDNVFVIGATNDLDDLYARLDTSEQSRFHGGDIIELHPYTDTELRGILEKRVQYGLDPAAVPDAVLDGIVKHANGDARIAIEALYKAVRSARDQGLNRIPEAAVEDAVVDAETDIRQRSLSKLKHKQRVLLDVLTELGGWCAMGAIEDRFTERHEPVTRETLRNHLRALIHYNHVETKGEKRWTRYRVVTDVTTSPTLG